MTGNTVKVINQDRSRQNHNITQTNKAKTMTTRPATREKIKAVPKEDAIQKQIIACFWHQTINGIKVRKFLHHSPNGGERPSKISSKGKRYSTEGNKLKEMGTKAGFPDLFLFVPMCGYHGLFIELKRPKKNKYIELIANHVKPVGSEAEDSQVDIISDLNSQGYLAVVAYGYDAATEFIRDYLKGLKVREVVREPIKVSDNHKHP